MSRRNKVLLFLAIVIAVLFLSYRVVPGPWARAMYGLETWRAGLSKKRVSALGREVAYLDGGSGETIVMIHGFGADKYTWGRFAGKLAGSYRTVALDLPGFGETPSLSGERFDIESQTTRAHQILQALGISKYHLIGNSMGGHIAGRIAHHWPEEVSTLALSDTHGVGLGPSPFAQRVEKGDNPFYVKTDADFRALTAMAFFKTPWIPRPIFVEQRDHAIATLDRREQMFSQVHPDVEALIGLLPE
jgi:pimeloyl-ACP methyl ester carboxylesterase